MSEAEYLQNFLYHLGRDYVPLGVLEKIVQDLEENKVWASDYVYTNNHLASYTKELADRILKPPASGA